MSTLQIIQLESGAFKHIDSIDGEFFLGRFNYKNEFNKAFLVEAYGAKRREYIVTDISVFDYLGTEETFTNFTDLNNRLVELGYTGIDTNSIVTGFLSDDINDYDFATTPLDDIDNFLVHQDGEWKKVEKVDVATGGGGGSPTTQRIVWYGRPDLSTIDNWYSNFGTFFRVWLEPFAFSSWGSASSPDGNIYNNGVNHLILPNSKLVSARVIIDGSQNNVNSELQIWIGTGQKGAGSPYPGIDINLQELVNHTISLPTGGSSIRLIVPLTILSHSTLVENKMYLAVRSKIAGNIWGIQLEAIFEEQ